MAAVTATEETRTRRRRRDLGEPAGSSGPDTRPTTTRKRARERLGKDIQEVAEDAVEHSHEAVWLDGPLALTLLPPLGSFLTGGINLRGCFIRSDRVLTIQPQGTLYVMV
jgi:hypothetical protein